MFEDDPAADSYDNIGKIYQAETIVASRSCIAELFKSPRYTWESYRSEDRKKQQIRREKRRLSAT